MIERYRQFSRGTGNTIESRVSAAVARFRLGSLLLLKGRKVEAKPELENAVDELEALVAERPSELLSRESLAKGCFRLAQCVESGTCDLSARYGERCQQLFKELLQECPEDTDLMLELSRSHTYLGFVRCQQARYDEAWQGVSKAERLAQLLLRGDPNNYRYQFTLVLAYKFYGRVRYAQNRFAEAEPWYLKSLLLNERLVRLQPNDFELWNTYSLTHHMIQLVYRGLENAEKSTELARRAAELRQQINTLFPGLVNYDDKIEEIIEANIETLLKLGRVEEARQAKLARLNEMVTLFGAQDPVYTKYLNTEFSRIYGKMNNPNWSAPRGDATATAELHARLTAVYIPVLVLKQANACLSEPYFCSAAATEPAGLV